MLIQRQAPTSMACAARAGEVMLSSRQMGVRICRWSVAWSSRSSWAQRLLDHRQVEVVQRPEDRRVGQPVAAVAVDVEGGRLEGGADGAHHVEVPARPELQLHAREAGLDGLADRRQQLVYRLHHAEVGADFHGVRRPAEQPPERRVLPPGLHVPPRQLEAGLGERVAFEEGQPVAHLVGVADLRTQQPGRQPVAHRAGRRRLPTPDCSCGDSHGVASPQPASPPPLIRTSTLCITCASPKAVRNG